MSLSKALSDRIEWMHPSWRDLVIEHLCGSASDRRRFLAACGLNGFLLALSQAGGRTGERSFPLLVDKQDWDLVNQGVERILRSEKGAGWQVLHHFTQQPQFSASFAEKSTEAHLLLGLLAETLAQLRKMWVGDQMPNQAILIWWYYQLSIHVRPLPPGPNLDGIWDWYLSAAREEVSTFDGDESESSLDEVEELFSLVDALIKNEPRFMEQIGFPICCNVLVEEFLPKLNTRAELEFDLDSSSDCSEECSFLDKIESVAVAITKHFPLKKLILAEIIESACDRRSIVEELENDLRREEEAESEKKWRSQKATLKNENTPTKSNSDWADRVRLLSIEQVFADL